ETVGSLVSDEALLDLPHLRRGVRNARDRGAATRRVRGFAFRGLHALAWRPQESIGWIVFRLVPRHERSRSGAREGDELLERIRAATEKAFGLSRDEVEPVDEGPVAIARGPCAAQEDR